jgi:hypothetical protein
MSQLFYVLWGLAICGTHITVNAHLVANYFSFPSNTILYTRSTGFTDDFYLWASSYHREDDWCMYLEDKDIKVQQGTGANDPIIPRPGKVCNNADPTDWQTVSGSGEQQVRQSITCYRSQGADYIGKGPSFIKRSHFTGGDFGSYWYQFPPLRLWASSSSTIVVNRITFVGFGCEGETRHYDFTVHFGCPKGMWEDTSVSWNSDASPAYCKHCPPGRYTDQVAQAGTSSNVCKVCPLGKFGDENAVPGRDSASYCTNCPAGRYGNAQQMSNALCSGPCLPGFYCPSNSINEQSKGGAAGSSGYEIDATFYGAEASPTSRPHPCPAGFFCPKGSGDKICHVDAPVGVLFPSYSYASDGGIVWEGNNRCRFRCGDYDGCASTALLDNQVSGKVVASKCYCHASSALPTFVSPGYFASGRGDSNYDERWTRDTQSICESPNFCRGGLCTDSNCDGWFHKCPAGRYGASSATGLSNSACSGPCLAGYYCEKGSSQADQKQCGSANKFCPASSVAPSAVQDNYISVCPPTSPQGVECPPTTREAEAPCPNGGICENGVVKSIEWGDLSGLGLCTANDPTKPNLGMGTGQLSENDPGATLHTRRPDGAWTNTHADLRARFDSNNLLPAGAFTILSQTCMAGIRSMQTIDDLKLESNTVKPNNTPLSTTRCSQYKLLILVEQSASGSIAVGNCTVIVDVLNVNDAPAWQSAGIVPRGIQERSIAGTRANLGITGPDGEGKYSLGNIISAPMVLDPDVGQDVFYSIVAGEPANVNETFGISKCSGDLYMKSGVSPLAYNPDDLYLSVCIKACDDPAFFGNREEPLFISRCASGNAFNTIDRCKSSSLLNTCNALKGLCVKVYVIDINDPPTFNMSATRCTAGPNTQCRVDELSTFGESIKSNTGSSGADISNQARDLDGDILKWSAKCLSCAPHDVGIIQRNNPAAVTTHGNHPFQDGDRVTFEGVQGMIEVNAGTQQSTDKANLGYRVTKTSANSFILSDFDSANLASATGGNGGSVRLAPVSVSNGVFKTNLLASRLSFDDTPLYSIEVSVCDAEFTASKTFQIKINDVNEPPIIPSNIEVSILENTVGGTTGYFIASDKEYAPGIIYTVTQPASGFSTTVSNEGGGKYTIRVDSSLDYENKTSHAVTVVATDAGLNPTDVQCFDLDACKEPKSSEGVIMTVIVLDVNEAPSVTPTFATFIPENTTIGSEVISFLNYHYNDPEDGIVKQFQMPSNPCFHLNTYTGQITVKTQLDYYLDISPPPAVVTGCKQQSHTLIVNVQDDLERSGINTTITIGVTDVDEAPWFASPFLSSAGGIPTVGVTLGEDTGDGSIVKGTTAVLDLSSGTKDPENQIKTYTLESGAVSVLETNSNSSLRTVFTQFVMSGSSIIVASTSNLDYETQSVFTLVVAVSDPVGHTQRGHVVVTLEDKNDAPILSSTTVETEPATWLTVGSHRTDCNTVPLGTATCATAPRSRAAKGSSAFDADDVDVIPENRHYVYTIIDYKKRAPHVSAWETDTLKTFEIDHVGSIWVRSGLNQANMDASGIQDPGTHYKLSVITNNTLSNSPRSSNPTADIYINVTQSNSPPYFVDNRRIITLNENAPIDLVVWGGIQAKDDLTSKLVFDAQVSNPRVNLYYNHDSDNLADLEVGQVGLNSLFASNGTNNLGHDGAWLSEANIMLKTSKGIDYERAGYAWVDHILNVSITVYDGSSTVSATLSIKILDVNEPPVWKLQIYEVSIWENNIVSAIGIEDFIALDVDIDDRDEIFEPWKNEEVKRPTCLEKCSYSILSVSATKLNQAKASPALGTAKDTNKQLVNISVPSFDFEEADLILVTVQANNNRAPSVKVGVTLSITILDRNEPPVIQSARFSLDEDVLVGWTMDISSMTSDPDGQKTFSFTKMSEKCIYSAAVTENTTLFAVSDNTFLQLGGSLDYENCPKYEVAIQVNDGGNGVPGEAPLDAEATFNIDINNVNDVMQPMFAPSASAYANLTTYGGTPVVFLGDNYGPSLKKRQNMGLGATTVVVEYAKCTTSRTSYTGILYVATQCEVQSGYSLGNTKIECQSVPGVGSGLCWRVSVDGDTSPFSVQTTSYARPIISAVPGSYSLPTSSGVTVYINGEYFGSNSNAPVVKYKNSVGNLFYATNCVVATDHVRISCISSKGAGKNLEWFVVVGGISSVGHTQTSAAGSSYKQAYISQIYVDGFGSSSTKNFLLGKGGQTLQVVGQNFGPNGTKVILEYGGYTTSDCAVRMDHVLIECISVAGIGKDLKARVTAADLPGLWTGDSALISYRVPVIMGLTGSGVSLRSQTTGNSLVEIHGENFGPPYSAPCTRVVAFKDPLLVKYGGIYTAKCCEVVSDMKIECLTTDGVGSNHSWSVTLADQTSVIFTATTTSYAPPIIRDYMKVKVDVTMFNTQGGEEIKIIGRNFGPYTGTRGMQNFNSISYGQDKGLDFILNATEDCRMTNAHTEIQCTIATGAGTELKWIIYVSGQESVSPTTAYAPPTIISIGPPHLRKKLQQQGGDVIYISGTNFGPKGSPGPYLEKVSYGFKGSKYDITGGCSVSVDSVEITCTTSKGIGGHRENGHIWYVTIRGQRSAKNTAANATTSYLRPMLSKLVADHGPTDAIKVIQGVASPIKLTLSGENMGYYSPLGSINQVWIVFNGVEYSPDFPRSAPAGQNSTYGGVESLSFNMPVGFGIDRSVDLYIHSGDIEDAVTAVSGLKFHYDDPEIQSVRLETFSNGLCYTSNINGQQYCQKLLTLEGKNFCPFPACAKLIVNGIEVNIETHSHKVLVAKVYDGSGSVQVNVSDGFGNWRSSETEQFTSLAPKLSSENATALQSISFTTKPHDEVLWIAGERFDGDPSKLCVTVGHCPSIPINKCHNNEPCDPNNKAGGRTANISSFYPKTGNIKVIVFTLPEGAGTNQELLIWKGGQPSSIENRANRLFINFKKPSTHAGYLLNGVPVIKNSGQTVSEISTQNKGTTFTLEGENFGNRHFGSFTFRHNAGNRRLRRLMRRFLQGSANAYVPQPVDLNKAKSKNGQSLIKEWTNEKIVFELPDGQGLSLSLVLTVGGQILNEGSIRVSYSPPTVTTVTPNSGPTEGKTKIIVGGTNFGCQPQLDTLCAGGQSVTFLPDHSAFPTLSLLSYGCSVSAADHTLLECITNEGEGKGMSTQVSVGSSFSAALLQSFSYSDPMIHTISHETSPTSGLSSVSGSNIIMTVSGVNFGPPSMKSTARVEFRCKDGISTFCTKGYAIYVNKTSPYWRKNHTHIEFAIPAGNGVNLQIVVIVAGVTSAHKLFSYDKPKIVSMTPFIAPTDGCGPNKWENLNAWQARVDSASKEEKRMNPEKFSRRCEDWTMVTILGRNFGPSYEHVQVWMGRCDDFRNKESCDLIDKDKCTWNNDRCENAPGTGTIGPFLAFDGPTAPSKSLLDCTNPQSRREICICQSTFSHEHITVCAPQGFGKNLSTVVSIESRDTSDFISWNYEKPQVHRSLPKPYDARGEQIEIRGINFGGMASPTNVIISGKPCLNAKWNDENPDDGLPYITCDAHEGIVGAKNISVHVALQGSDTVKALQNMKSSLIYSICKFAKPRADGQINVYWGTEGDLCTVCPQGAACVPNSILQPNSSSGFYRELLDISEPVSEVDDIIGQKAADDYKRAKRRCPKERLLTSEMKAKFPLAKQKNQCLDFVACIPRDACLGDNTCAPEYLHEQINCEKKQLETMPCSVDLQCRIRSGGGDCVAAIQSVCKCPAKWNPKADVLTCLKTCVRTHGDVLTSACGQLRGRQDSVVSNLQAALARAECGKENPEDCSECVVKTNQTSGELYGECECTSSYRCSMCTSGSHFRLNSVCESCPKDPLLFIILAIFGLISLCVLMFELDRRRFNLAFVNIGWDYFQVLSMFTDADVQWPPALKQLYQMFSFFSFDMDVVAPECLVPEFKFETKFYITILSPVICIAMLTVGIGCILCHNHAWKGWKWSNRDRSVFARFHATFLLICYFLYVALTRKALEVFNCNPLHGAYDGFLYTDFTSYDCDSGPCRCDDPRHIQLGLQLPAIITILVMTVGFPVGLFLLLRSKKKLIKEDQLLRAAGIGDTEETSSNKLVYSTRLSYHKVYYHFLPGKTYWITYIIIRKGAIAAAALAFRANPGFQLATVVLILFIAYVMQVKHRPYMSTSQRKEALAQHALKAEERDEQHVRIRERIRAAREYAKTHTRGANAKNDVKFGMGIVESSRIGKKIKSTREYFWDYNTVEQVLLASAILVALAGVMFESDRFQYDDSGRFSWQRELITYLLLMVVYFSLTYYMVVFISELYGKTPLWVAKIAGAAFNRTHGIAVATHDSKTKTMELTFQNNPLMSGNTAAQEKERAALNDRLKAQDAAIKQNVDQQALLLARLRNEKKGNIAPSSKRGKKPGRKDNKKKQFTQMRAGSVDET